MNSIGKSDEVIAIQNDDFPILIDSSKLVAALIAGTAFGAWAPVAIAALIHLLYRMRKKRIVLTALQGAILRELIESGPMSASDIQTLIGIEDANLESIKAELQALSSVRKADGTVTSLVDETDAEMWIAVDI